MSCSKWSWRRSRARCTRPAEVFASSLDTHHSFFVRYAVASGGDSHLDMHHDAAEVTLNVCLGKEFRGSGLRFCGRFGDSDHRKASALCAHTPGYAILHLGRQRHGADTITEGERLNLIMWARSSAFRAAAAYGHTPPDGYPHQPERGPPDQLCLSQSNDADYEIALAALADGETTRPLPPVCAAGACSRSNKKARFPSA